MNPPGQLFLVCKPTKLMDRVTRVRWVCRFSFGRRMDNTEAVELRFQLQILLLDLLFFLQLRFYIFLIKISWLT